MAENWEKVAYEDDVVTKALMTAAGDIFYASGASTPTVLAKGSDGQVLELASGIPSWAAKGFTAKGRAYQSTVDQYIDSGNWRKVLLDAEIYDAGNDFNTTLKSGAADATEGNKLHDADGGFASTDVGSTIWNSTDCTYTTVAAYVDSGELTLDDDIMADGESYHLYHARFTIPATGYYAVCGSIRYSNPTQNKLFYLGIRKNGSSYCYSVDQSATTSVLVTTVADIVYASAADYLELFSYHNSNGSEQMVGHYYDTFLAIHRLS